MRGPLASRAAIRASRTTPTLWVLVIATGEVSRPDSRTHSRPVSSPLPFSRWQPANTGSVSGSSAEGNSTVTPVRTASPRTRVACPTRTPATSVIAFPGPGRPVPMVMPRSRARIGYQYLHPASFGSGPASRGHRGRMEEAQRREQSMDVQELTSQARDALTVKRVFGEPYEKDGLTIIPAARVQGAVGGGSGEDPQGQGKGPAAASA